MSALDKQVDGSHYKDMKIQPVEFIVANGLEYRVGNVIKYACRHQSKNGLKDIEKAMHYLEMIAEDWESDPNRDPSAQEPDEDGWIPWSGGSLLPVHGLVDVKFRDGFIATRSDASSFSWDSTLPASMSTIIAYRKAK